MLYFTPQILMQSGAGDLLANIGIDGESASIMASGVTCFLMLPCIMMAMWLMDRSGRRYISCSSLPFLTYIHLSSVFLTVHSLFAQLITVCGVCCSESAKTFSEKFVVVFCLQAIASSNHSCSCNLIGGTCAGQHVPDNGFDSSCGFFHMCHNIHMCLCGWIWPNSQHSLLRNLPNEGARCVHWCVCCCYVG